MKKRIARERRREQGMALLVAALSLALIGAITLAAINNSGLESTASGRSRSAMRTLHAADAGFRFATKRLSEEPANLAAFTLNLGDRTVQSRTRTDAGPQPIALAGTGAAPAGYAVNVGSGFSSELYLITITATGPDGGSAEIEAKIGRLSSGIGGY